MCPCSLQQAGNHPAHIRIVVGGPVSPNQIAKLVLPALIRCIKNIGQSFVQQFAGRRTLQNAKIRFYTGRLKVTPQHFGTKSMQGTDIGLGECR